MPIGCVPRNAAHCTSWRRFMSRNPARCTGTEGMAPRRTVVWIAREPSLPTNPAWCTKKLWICREKPLSVPAGCWALVHTAALRGAGRQGVVRRPAFLGTDARCRVQAAGFLGVQELTAVQHPVFLGTGSQHLVRRSVFLGEHVQAVVRRPAFLGATARWKCRQPPSCRRGQTKALTPQTRSERSCVTHPTRLR